MMALFSTVFEYFMRDLILYDVLYLVVHTHNFFIGYLLKMASF